MFLINNNTNKKEVNSSHDHEHPNYLQETPKEEKRPRGPEALKRVLEEKRYNIPKNSKSVLKLSLSFKDRPLKVSKFQNEFMKSSFFRGVITKNNLGKAKPMVGHNLPPLIEIGLTYLKI